MFEKLKAKIFRDKISEEPSNNTIPLLIIIRPKDGNRQAGHLRHYIMIEQPIEQTEKPSTHLPEIPSDVNISEADFSPLIMDIEKETGIQFHNNICDLANLARTAGVENELLKAAVYSTSNGTKDYVPVLLSDNFLDQVEWPVFLKKLAASPRARAGTGTLRYYEHDEFCKLVAQDKKARASLALYEGLIKAGELHG